MKTVKQGKKVIRELKKLRSSTQGAVRSKHCCRCCRCCRCGRGGW